MSAWELPEGKRIAEAIRTLYPDPAEVVARLALHDDFINLADSILLAEESDAIRNQLRTLLKKLEAIKKGRTQDEKNPH
jgi:hypothetical protein